MGELSAEQRRLARHALGLPNDRRSSYRNRFFAGPMTPTWWNWQGMVEGGGAVFYPASGGETSDLFVLTRSAAEAVLERGETLDLEDFPHD